MASLRRLAALASAVLLAAGCGGGGGPTASDEAVSQRVVDYFQKTVTTPCMSDDRAPSAADQAGSRCSCRRAAA